MPDNFAIYTSLLFGYLILMMFSVICGSFIRPYVKKNGRSTARGVNYSWGTIANASIADEIAKKKGEYPWFLRLFWIITFLEFGSIVGAIITVIIMTR
jgi:hypothetical protein